METQKSNKKILYVITKSNWGGAQRYVYDLATHAKERGFTVLVACGSTGELTERLEKKDIPLRIIPSLGRNVRIFKELHAFFALLFLFRKERPDIIHLNSSKVGAMGGLAGRIARVPKILFTAHGWAFNEERTLFSRIIIAFIHYLTVFFSHQTIAVSK